MVIEKQISRLEHVSSPQTDQAGARTWDRHTQVQTPPLLTPTPGTHRTPRPMGPHLWYIQRNLYGLVRARKTNTSADDEQEGGGL